MLDMHPDSSAYSADFASSAVFRLNGIDYITFSVAGTFATGTVTIQYSPTRANVKAGTWYDLDTTNLVFTAVGAAVALWGDCYIRAKGTNTITSAVKLFISGNNITRPDETERTNLGGVL
jgi:hypothetical protein